MGCFHSHHEKNIYIVYSLNYLVCCEFASSFFFLIFIQSETCFDLSVTDESYVDETRVWRIKL